MTMKSFNKYIVALALAGSLAVSCSKPVEVGRSDAHKYEIMPLSGWIADASSAKSEKVIELRAENCHAAVQFRLNKAPRQGVDISFQYDAAALNAYNQEHGTDFEILPEENFSFDADSTLVMAPDETASYSIPFTISYSETLEDDHTYVLPLRAVCKNKDVLLSESNSTAFYLVKNFKNASGCDKGGSVKTFLFYEVNDTNPLNTLNLVLDDGKGTLFLDYVSIFAANINYDAAKGRVYIKCNENVQFLLDNYDSFIKPLRDKGVKVLMTILGNHDEAGLSQLSKEGARDFARELAAFCRNYKLDGIVLDDEYSKLPDTENPLLEKRSTAAAARMAFEAKRAMPDKVIAIYSIGSMYRDVEVDGYQPGDYIDIAVPDYNKTVRPLSGMTLANLAGMSVEFVKNLGSTSYSTASNVKSQGYGYFMMFAPFAGVTKEKPIDTIVKTDWSKMNTVCRGLYGKGLLPMDMFYEKNSVIARPVK